MTRRKREKDCVSVCERECLYSDVCCVSVDVCAGVFNVCVCERERENDCILMCVVYLCECRCVSECRRVCVFEEGVALFNLSLSCAKLTIREISFYFFLSPSEGLENILL